MRSTIRDGPTRVRTLYAHFLERLSDRGLADFVTLKLKGSVHLLCARREPPAPKTRMRKMIEVNEPFENIIPQFVRTAARGAEY